MSCIQSYNYNISEVKNKNSSHLKILLVSIIYHSFQLTRAILCNLNPTPNFVAILNMMPLKVNEPLAVPSEKKPAEEPKKLKPCCACPETKRVRDAW